MGNVRVGNSKVNKMKNVLLARGNCIVLPQQQAFVRF